MDVALENMGSMWLLEGKHTDPSIGFLGVRITVASSELLTHWAVFSQPHFWNIRVVFTVFREKLCLGGFSVHLVFQNCSVWPPNGRRSLGLKFAELLRQAALAPVLDLPLLL